MAIRPKVNAENRRIHTCSSHWVAVSINENVSSQALASTSAVRVDSDGGECARGGRTRRGGRGLATRAGDWAPRRVRAMAVR